MNSIRIILLGILLYGCAMTWGCVNSSFTYTHTGDTNPDIKIPLVP